jgi:hypothetical protein
MLFHVKRGLYNGLKEFFFFDDKLVCMVQLENECVL